jgi:hypothetical protein
LSVEPLSHSEPLGGDELETASSLAAQPIAITCRREREVGHVHPVFVGLFLEAGADDPLSTKQKRRRGRRARRNRPVVMTRAAAGDRAAGLNLVA